MDWKQPYLADSEFIDSGHPAVLRRAHELRVGCAEDVEIAQRCFEFVRDHIRHSWDFRLNPVTCAASDVLQHGTGYCYAKSHLLAALLRANGIPAGLCYQRLAVEPGQQRYCLHGLNAVYLNEYGWYRVDARGNKPGIEADFCPPVEKLAFAVAGVGEADLPEVWSAPLTVVVHVLRTSMTCDEVYDRMPDIELLSVGAGFGRQDASS